MSNIDKSKKKKHKKEVIDLTSFITADELNYDPYGSYTGTTASTYYDDEYDQPVQDADDL